MSSRFRAATRTIAAAGIRSGLPAVIAIVIGIGGAAARPGSVPAPDSSNDDGTSAPAALSEVVRLSDAAVAAVRAGRPAEARRTMRDAGRTALGLPEDDADAPFVLANWGQFLLGQGSWESAEAVASTAEQRAVAIDDTATRVRAMRIRGEALRLLGRFEEADGTIRAARAVEIPAPDAEAAELDLSAALLAIDRSQPGDALPATQRAIAVARELAKPDLEWRARLARAEALVALDRIEGAEAELSRCEESATGPRQRADVQQRRAMVARTARNTVAAREAADDMLREAERWIEAAPTAEERAERGRGSRGYVETALDVRFGPDPAGDGRAWPEGISWIRRVQGASEDPPDRDDGNEIDVLWFWGSDRVIAFTGGADAPIRVRDCGPSGTLDEWILLFRSLLAKPGAEADRDRTGRWLVDALFGGTPPAGRTLRVEPDGPLAALPFALLPTPDGPLGIGSAIVRGHRATATAPVSDAGSPVHTRELLILADPSLPQGRPSASSLPPLPGARAEARAIAARVVETRVLVGDAAKEARVVGTTVPAVLHIAAHGSPDPDDPAVLLAPGEGRDGHLTPDEVRRLPRVPQVVVLSSCESLLTDVSGRNSTGSVGTAFLEAGAGTVVGALWSVEDRALGPFMAAFHAYLREGARPSEAMRRARAESAGEDPFAWAAFVVRGADEPVRLPPPPEPPNRGPEAAVGFLAALAFAGLLLWTRRLPPPPMSG